MAARLANDLSDCHAFIAGVGQGGGRYLGVALLMVVNDGQDEAAVGAYARRVLEEEGTFTRERVPERRVRRRLRLTVSRDDRDEERNDVPLHWSLVALGVASGSAAVAFWWLLR